MNSNHSTSSLELPNPSLLVIGMVDHSILDRDSSLFLVEASSMTVPHMPPIFEEEKSQDNGTRSTSSTPDKPVISLQEVASQEASKDPQVPVKTKSTQRRGRDQRAKRVYQAA